MIFFFFLNLETNHWPFEKLDTWLYTNCIPNSKSITGTAFLTKFLIALSHVGMESTIKIINGYPCFVRELCTMHISFSSKFLMRLISPNVGDDFRSIFMFCNRLRSCCNFQLSDIKWLCSAYYVEYILKWKFVYWPLIHCCSDKFIHNFLIRITR